MSTSAGRPGRPKYFEQDLPKSVIERIRERERLEDNEDAYAEVFLLLIVYVALFFALAFFFVWLKRISKEKLENDRRKELH
jgi:predicted permease